MAKGNSLIWTAAFVFFALVAGNPKTTYSILRKPEFAGGDGAARGKIVNGFAKRPTVSER